MKKHFPKVKIASCEFVRGLTLTDTGRERGEYVSVLVEGGRSGGGLEPSHTVPVAVQDEEILNSFLHSNLHEELSQ